MISVVYLSGNEGPFLCMELIFQEFMVIWVPTNDHERGEEREMCTATFRMFYLLE